MCAKLQKSAEVSKYKMEVGEEIELLRRGGVNTVVDGYNVL